MVAQTGAARSYAESLVRIVELRVDADASALATGIFTRRSRLRERIEMLLLRGREFSPAAARAPVAAAALVLAGVAAAGALAPHWIAFAQRLEFEVASVKTSNGGPFEFAPRRSGDRVSIHMTHIGGVITYAYHIPYYRLIGYDKTAIAYEWYDIDAKLGRDATEDQVRLMFQSLLEERFKLKVHRETRELPEYELAIGKGKPRITPSGGGPMTVTIEGKHWTPGAGTCSTTSWRDGARIVCHAANMAKIAEELSGLLGAPVADRTGLTGTYDLNVRYVPDNRTLDADMEPGPSLVDAVQQELGLKLEKGKGPVDVIVIDHIEKPSPN